MGTQRMGERLVSMGLVAPWQVDAALHWQERFGGMLGEILVEARFAAPGPVYEAIAKELGVRFVQLEGRRIAEEALALMPRSFARRHRIVPLQLLSCGSYRLLIVASADPANEDLSLAIRLHTKANVRMVLATPADIERALVEHGLAAPKREVVVSEAW